MTSSLSLSTPLASDDSALVTGGAGYIGALAVEELLAPAARSRVLDSLLHGQEDVADASQGAASS